ncbi:MAG TPA: ATP-binding protein [Nitrolancea sp.]|nr:ATP-binding protein [Nitrolancea sp.]
MRTWAANHWSPAAWLQQQLQSRTRGEPSAKLFRGLRLRLTIWYGLVLTASLLAVGVSLYLVLQHQLLETVGDQLSAQNAILAREWVRLPNRGCPGIATLGSRSGSSMLPIYVACYDTGGGLLGVGTGDASRLTPPNAFLDGNLVQTALEDGSASDIVEGGPQVGPIFRYAVAVHIPGSGEERSVIQVGQSVSQVEGALGQLRRLLLLFGFSSLALATIGGLWLSNRALAPARLAFARQQAFIADASHELRTPLTLLRANAEVLLRHRQRFPEGDAELLEDIVGETAHMSIMAGNLLTLARLDAGRLIAERDILSLSELMRAAARRVSALAAEEDLSITLELAPDAAVVGDRAALEQAILIFIDNAVKYTPPGGRITLRTSDDDGVARAAVSDTGIGIAPDYLPRLSERFYRVDVARSRATGGAGLGLAIAHGIAAAHQGRIEIDSEPNSGTTVTLSLPAARRRARTQIASLETNDDAGSPGKTDPSTSSG